MKITYKFDEDELYSFNMFRATRKNAGTVPSADADCLCKLGSHVGDWLYVPDAGLYLHYFCSNGSSGVWLYHVVFAEPNEAVGKGDALSSTQGRSDAPDDHHTGG